MRLYKILTSDYKQKLRCSYRNHVTLAQASRMLSAIAGLSCFLAVATRQFGLRFTQ